MPQPDVSAAAEPDSGAENRGARAGGMNGAVTGSGAGAGGGGNAESYDDDTASEGNADRQMSAPRPHRDEGDGASHGSA